MNKNERIARRTIRLARIIRRQENAKHEADRQVKGWLARMPLEQEQFTEYMHALWSASVMANQLQHLYRIAECEPRERCVNQSVFNEMRRRKKVVDNAQVSC